MLTPKKRKISLFKIFVYTSLAALVTVAIAGYILRRTWGKDVESLKISSGEYSFRSQRDSNGIWEVQSDSSKSLWFAMGYLQNLDREFQLELVRRVATGRLSEWFGERTLSRDKIMRHLVDVGKWDWENQKNDPLLKESVEAFVDGQNHYMKETKLPIPFEYRVLGIQRTEIQAIEPWEIMAIARFHTWQFSYDSTEDLDANIMNSLFPKELIKILKPQISPMDSATLYRQGNLRSSVKIRPYSGSKFSMPGFVVPEAQVRDYQPQKSLPAREAKFDKLSLEAPVQGASNAWMISNPDTGLEPTLCNDPHLNLNWPSSLYPIKYHSAGLSHGVGFMLPGVPGLVLGRVHNENSQLAWGVTLATFADTQDYLRIPLSSIDGPQTRAKNEKFLIKSRAENLEAKNINIQQEWTPWGPRIDHLISVPGIKSDEIVVFDWMGFRKVPSILKFFVKRTLNAADQLEYDLHQDFAYPAVNFNWIESRAKTQINFGHMVTGWIIQRDRKNTPQGLVNTKEPRKFSPSWDRPYLKETYNQKDPFLMVTGNQRIWENSISDELAYSYTNSSRTQRILDQKPHLIRDPSSGQRDAYIPELHKFWKLYRQWATVDRLCSQGDSEYQKDCRNLVSAVDGWNGVALVEKFEPLVVATLYALVKYDLWPSSPSDKSKDWIEAKIRWHKSSVSYNAIDNILTNENLRNQWIQEKKLKNSFEDFLIDHFHLAIKELRAKYGPFYSQWTWGQAHKIAWTHPFTVMPGPVGEMLNESVFGPPRPVPGGFDSPQRFDISWNPNDPARFPAQHGSTLRFCTSFNQDKVAFEKQKPIINWANSTGVSGNPFSNWATAFPNASFFKDLLSPSSR